MPLTLFYLQIIFAVLVALMLVFKFARKQWFNRMGDQVWQQCLLSTPSADATPPAPSDDEPNLNVLKFPRLGRRFDAHPDKRPDLSADDLYWYGNQKLEYMMKVYEETRKMNDVELTLWIAIPVITALVANYVPMDDFLVVLYVGSFLLALKGLFAVLVGEGTMLYTLSRLERLEKKFPIVKHGFMRHRLYMLR